MALRYRKTPMGILADVLVYVLLIVAALSCVIPFVHILAVSFSSAGPAAAGNVGLWPVDFSGAAYTYISTRVEFWRSVTVTLRRVALGVVVNMILTVLFAFPLSKTAHRFPARRYYVAYIFWAMLFSGGLIPTYMTVYRTGIIGTIWALVLPGAVPIFNVIVLMNFFRGLPDEIEEAAIIDGAGHWKVLLSIYLPLSTAALATVLMFVIIGHWNAWFDGLIYSNKSENYPLQSYMQTILAGNFANLSIQEMAQFGKVSDRTVKAAQVFLGCMPVLLVYPFLQRYFTKGLVLGSVKG
jgi:putative aldouronate transport system permease protein